MTQGNPQQSNSGATGPSLAIPTIASYFQGVANRPPSPAFVEDILSQQPGEYAIIAGRTGQGKTILAFQLAHCLSTGTDFLKHKVPQPVQTGFLALEGDDQNFWDRYKKVSPNFPDPQGRLCFELLDKQTPEKLLAKIKTKIPGFQVVIFDGSRYLFRGDYCKPKDARDFVASFMETLKVNGVVGILTLQVKKPNPNSLAEPDDVYNIKGATEIVDDVTTAIMVEKVKGAHNKDLRIIYFPKHRISPLALPDRNVTLDRATCLFR